MLMKLLWKIFQMFLKRLNTELSYDPAILLPSIYIQTKHVYIKTCIRIIIKALLIIASEYKQPKYTSTSSTINYSAAVCWNTIWSYKGIQYQYILLHG